MPLLKSHRFIPLIACLLHVVMWTSCTGCLSDFGNDYTTMRIDSTSDVVYHHYIGLNDNGWKQGDSIVFNLPLFETPADLELNLSVRYTNLYPYQNLQIVAFLAEQDTTNIINSLPIRQNDSRIDSLIQIQDSLLHAKEMAEHFKSKKMAERDSMFQSNPDSLLRAERLDSLRKDSIQKAKRKMEEANGMLLAEGQQTDSLLNDSDALDSIRREKEAAMLREARRADSLAAVTQSLTHAISFSLFSKKDKKKGEGMLFMETGTECGTIHLKANTRYKIIITHNMKDPVLKGISDIGVELRRSKTAKPLNKHTRWW